MMKILRGAHCMLLATVAVLTLSSAQKMRRKELEQIVEQQSQEPVTKTFRNLDACEELAKMPSDNLRAAGMAIAKNVNEAKSAASADARNQLAQMMRVVVNTASQNKNTTDKKRAKSIGDQMMSQYVYQSVDSTKPIHWSIYDLSDGTVQVYVCMEMVKKSAEFEADLESRVAEAASEPEPTVEPTAQTPTPASPQRVVAPSAQTNPDAEALFEKGRDNCRRFRYDLGIPQLAEAVEKGSINAQYFVGLMYLYGDNVEKDSKLSFQYLLSAANGSHKEAIFQVAEMYNSGTGVEKNKEEARYWYERAGELGDVRAESRLRRL